MTARVPRVIPALLLKDDVFVKTTQFAAPRYVGDPLNTIDLFNQFEVDEIAVLDIGATVEGRSPAFRTIELLASVCWVPLAYGGGIRSLEQARRVFALGVEKVVLGTILADEPAVATEIARVFGRQAVVAAVDVIATATSRAVVVEHGRRVASEDPIAYARAAEAAGAGELLLQAVHRDGTREGFDLELIAAIAGAVSIPVIALGGADRRSSLAAPVQEAGAAAVAAGSLFVFQRRSANVLVNFPSRGELEAIFAPDQ